MQNKKRRKIVSVWGGYRINSLSQDTRNELVSFLKDYLVEKIVSVTLVDYSVYELSLAYMSSQRLMGLLGNYETFNNQKLFSVNCMMLRTIHHCMTIYRDCHLFLANKNIKIKRVLSLAQTTELKTLTLANNRLGWMPKGTFFNVVTQNIVKQYLHKTITHYEVGIQATLHFLKPILKAMYNDYYLKNEYVLDTNLVFKLPENSQHLVSALWETVKMNK